MFEYFRYRTKNEILYTKLLYIFSNQKFFLLVCVYICIHNIFSQFYIFIYASLLFIHFMFLHIFKSTRKAVNTLNNFSQSNFYELKITN